MPSPSSDLTLALDTAGDTASIVLADAHGVRSQIFLDQRALARDLAPALQALCQQSSAMLTDISSIRACVGPGSFTGIRLGLALIAGLTLARPRHALGFTRLQMLAAHHDLGTGVVLLPSIQQDVFLQTFRDGRPATLLSVVARHAVPAQAAGLPIFSDANGMTAAILLALPDAVAVPLQPVYGRRHYAAG